jgi:hypothetical protein
VIPALNDEAGRSFAPARDERLNLGEHEMRISRVINRPSLAIIGAALFAFASLTLIARAGASASLNIVNNSSRTIRNVYLSHADADDWGNDQLGESSIAPGQSFTLSSLACDQQQIKVIAEDQDGCFASTVVSCDGSSTWTITDSTARDCGNN